MLTRLFAFGFLSQMVKGPSPMTPTKSGGPAKVPRYVHWGGLPKRVASVTVSLTRRGIAAVQDAIPSDPVVAEQRV
jgi:hypothetical protein